MNNKCNYISRIVEQYQHDFSGRSEQRELYVYGYRSGEEKSPAILPQGGRNNLDRRLYDSGSGMSLVKLTSFLPNMMTTTLELLFLQLAESSKVTPSVYVPL